MIRSVNSTSKHIHATGGGPLPYVGYNPINPAQGALRLNGDQMEVFDGNTWIKMYAGTGDIGLSLESEAALDWAIKQMKQEQEWYKLASSNEAVRIALEQLEQTKQRLELITILSKEHETTTS